MAIIQRGTGDRPGGSIVDSMLVDLPSQLARGTYEINESADKLIVDLTLVQNGFIEPGRMIQIQYKGNTLIGRILSLSISAAITTRAVQDLVQCSVEVPYGYDT